MSGDLASTIPEWMALADQHEAMSREHRPLISPVGLTVLRWLARRDKATSTGIGAACALAPREVRFHLASLASLRFVVSRLDKAKDAPCLIYFVTDEGRLVAGIVEAKVTL